MASTSSPISTEPVSSPPVQTTDPKSSTSVANASSSAADASVAAQHPSESAPVVAMTGNGEKVVAQASSDLNSAVAPAQSSSQAVTATGPVATTSSPSATAGPATTTTTTTADPADTTKDAAMAPSTSTVYSTPDKDDKVKEKEKAPASSNAVPNNAPPQNTAAPASKKRRKRTGLAGLFAKLGCLSGDEFEDMPVPKTTPTPATRPAVSTAVKTPAPAPANGPSKRPTAAVATTAGAVTAAVGATVAAAAASTTATNGASSASAESSSPSDSAPAGPEKDVASREAISSITPSPSNNSVTASPDDAVLVPPHGPTTAPLEETAGLTSAAVQAPGGGSEIIHQHMLHRNESEQHLHSADQTRTETSGGYTDLSETDDNDVGGQQEMMYTDDDYEDEEDRLIAQGGIGIPLDENGIPAPLLPTIGKLDTGRKCLVLDLDETLLHSSFKMLPSADYIVPVEIESQTHNVYVIKRPGVDHFLQEMGKLYEIVVFTASLSKYADPVLDMLDVSRVVRHRLFRESCYNHKGNYVKDLSQLGRDISTCIIIDNSPASYIFHPNNAVPVSTWFNDPHDTELTDLCPFLTDLAGVDDVRGVLDGSI